MVILGHNWTGYYLETFLLLKISQLQKYLYQISITLMGLDLDCQYHMTDSESVVIRSVNDEQPSR